MGIRFLVIAASLMLVTGAIMGQEGGTAPKEGGSAAPSGRDVPGRPLHLLTYDHGGVILWGADHFLVHVRSAIQWLDRYPGFKIGLENEAYTYDYLAAHRPEALAEVRGYLKRYAGRFGVGTCTYGQPLSVFINEESNLRQIQLALEADRRHLGSAPRVYLMSEHAMHSQMPQILKGLGFEGAILRTHFMMYGYNPTFNVPVGWWVGLDGTRVPAVPTYVGQGAAFGRTTKDNWILTRYPGPECRAPLETFRDEFAHIVPLLATRADDAGLRREELVKEYEGKPGYRWVLLEEIFPVFPDPAQELKTGPNDFRVRMPWGYSGNEIWNECRRAEVAVLTAERLAALAGLRGGPLHEEAIQDAWKDLLIAQHHDIQICGILKDARTFLPRSLANARKVQDSALRFLAARMAGGDLAQATVFNPHSWRCPQWVELDVSLPRGSAVNLAARHGDRNVPLAVLASDRHGDGSVGKARVAILADPPPLGAASYALVAAAEGEAETPSGIRIQPDGPSVKTSFLTIRFGATGGIASLRDTRTDRPLLRTDRRSCFFAAAVDGKPCESRGVWAIERAHGGAGWTVAREAGLIGGIPYTLTMVIHDESPRIDCRAVFHLDGQRLGRLSDNRRDAASAFLHEEKLRFKVFPAVEGEVRGIRDLPFAVAETDDRYVDGNYWTAVAGPTGGMAVFNRGTMGSVREKDGGFAVPLAFAMYYIWGTRMLSGDFTYEFALYPFSGSWQEADLHRRALEYSFPFVGTGTAPGDASLGRDVSVLGISSAGAVLSALYTRKGETYARVYEYRGGAAQVSVAPPRGLTEVDLGGNERGPVSSPLTLGPWQIRTIRIEHRP